MRFEPTPLAGAYVVDTDPHIDERGGFIRTFCEREFEEHQLDPRVAQCNLSWTSKRGTLRGLHFQNTPHGEAKTVRVVAGAIFDVIVDLRDRSKTYARYFSVELTADNRRALYVPAGFAHGFLTLTADSVVYYQMSTPFVADAAAGIRWNDPTIAVAWPFEPTLVSERDRALPLLSR